MINQPKSKSSHHVTKWVAIVECENTPEIVIASANPMRSAALYCKAKTKKDGKVRKAIKIICRMPKPILSRPYRALNLLYNHALITSTEFDRIKEELDKD